MAPSLLAIQEPEEAELPLELHRRQLASAEVQGRERTRQGLIFPGVPVLSFYSWSLFPLSMSGLRCYFLYIDTNLHAVFWPLYLSEPQLPPA